MLLNRIKKYIYISILFGNLTQWLQTSKTEQISIKEIINLELLFFYDFVEVLQVFIYCDKQQFLFCYIMQLIALDRILISAFLNHFERKILDLPLNLFGIFKNK